MISNQVLQSMAVKYQTTELNLRREYFQHLFLSTFYQQAKTDQIYFKGGTALRLIFNSPRFSEDLDCISGVEDIVTIEEAIFNTLTAITRENIDVDLSEATVTSGGYLALITFQADAELINIQLELSLREGEKQGEAVLIASEFMPAFLIVALEKDLLIKEKIQALLSRKKPRDFFDLYFILRANLLPPEEKHILANVADVLAGINLNFEKELKEFLPRSHWAIIRDFPRPLEREIERFM